MSFTKRTILTNLSILSILIAGCTTTSPEHKSSTSTMMTNRAAETEQQLCFSTTGVIDCAASGKYFGQDAQYKGNSQSYTVLDDGTVSDNITGLIWTQSPDTNNDDVISKSDKLSSSDAVKYCDALEIGGHADWQLPTIKQGYSLINFRGLDIDPMATDTSDVIPFVDTQFFGFAYGNPQEGERVIDSQYASTSKYINDEGEKMLFGVNFSDGRIKGYGENFFGSPKTYYVQCVRGNTDYGTPNYVDNGDKTITDSQSGLMWSKGDSGSEFAKGINYKNAFDWTKSDENDISPLKPEVSKNGAMNWVEALAYVQKMNKQNYLGYNDWRLPSAKELETITDYRFSPAKTHSPAIDPIFNMTTISNENGNDDWAFYWSNTTHKSLFKGTLHANYASYIAFGRSMGYSKKYGKWVDVHGAGSQRSDPKVWDGVNYAEGHGPQQDAIRIYNYVRLVRDAS